jgi:hypothetical protein
MCEGWLHALGCAARRLLDSVRQATLAFYGGDPPGERDSRRSSPGSFGPATPRYPVSTAVLHYPEATGGWCSRDVMDRCHSPDVTDRSHSQGVTVHSHQGATDRFHFREATAGSRYPEEWVDRARVDPRVAADVGAVEAVAADWVAAADSAGSVAADDEAAAACASNSSADRTTADLCNNGPSNRRY